MKIKRFELKAFGPFTNHPPLEFDDSDGPGLHIVFGHNEAGKSSSLRALKAFLYGFPEQTPDNFLHANKQLLVGGCLLDAEGRELNFQRRKKRKSDILDCEGNPIDPAILASFLHNTESGIFESLYGVDHEKLIQGGEDILAQKGEVGQALFAAGAGMSSLRKILDDLDTAAESLFKARGTKQRINIAVAEYNTLEKKKKKVSLSSKEWKEHRKLLATTEQERDQLEKELVLQERHRRQLERLKRSIPHLSAQRLYQQRLKILANAVLLPEGFAQQRRDIEQRQIDITLRLKKCRTRLTDLNKKQQAISLDVSLLDHADTIVTLQESLGKYRKDRQDSLQREGSRTSLKSEAATLLKQVRADLSLGEIETLRPLLLRKRTLQSLTSRHESLVGRLKATTKQRLDAEQELERLKRTLSQLPASIDSRSINQSIKTAARVGDIDKDINTREREIDTARKECQSTLKRIGLWFGELQELINLALPLEERLKSFELKFTKQEETGQRIDKQQEETKKRQRQVDSEIRRIDYVGEVATEEELQLSRRQRDKGWQLLCRQWLDGEDITEEARQYGNGLNLPEVYEKNILKVDDLADRLRREAERVAGYAALRAQAEEANIELAQLDEEKKTLLSTNIELAKQWQELWQGYSITPLPPREMHFWLNEVDKLRFKATAIDARQHEVEEKKTQRLTLIQLLKKELQKIGETPNSVGKELAPLFTFTETAMERIEKNQSIRDRTEEKITDLTTKIENATEQQAEAEKELQEWQDQWQKALTELIRNEIPTPSEALDALDVLHGCFLKLKEAEDYQKRIKGIARDIATYEEDIATLLRKVDPELLTKRPEETVPLMRTRLDNARRNKTLLDQHNEEISTLNDEVQEGEIELTQNQKQMNHLLETAKCNKVDELDTVIRNSKEIQKDLDHLAETETNLTLAAEGIPLAELAQLAENVDPDDLPEQIRSISKEIEEKLQPEIKRLSEVSGAVSKELQLMEGGDDASKTAEEVEQIGATIKRLANQYMRLKLAAKILHQEIERYRNENQDPVLRIASGYFSSLTLGSFSDLRTDVGDKDEPILVGLRPDNSRITVEGMSSGTRDQLYLALRFATLEWRLQSSEPMPFIVDDILINFDDERTKATIDILAHLAKKTQVILFTHHQRVVDDARRIASEAPIHIYELNKEETKPANIAQ